MYCENCQREWKPRDQFCVMCGRQLVERSIEARRLELQHVRWLLGEISRWDRYSIVQSVRAQLTAQYVALEEILEASVAQVEGASPVQPNPIAEALQPAHSEPALPVTENPEAPEAPPARKEEVEEEVFAPPVPSADDRVVAAASTWHRIWKPFLTESVGWFIGGFLILAGTLSLVAMGWGSLSDASRALTVFGFAGGWTLAFVTWARFLLRREHTQGAGVVLERIAAIIAPLATVAVGPVRDNPILFWPVVVGWSVVAAWLGRAATRRVDERGATPVAIAVGLATVVMGGAPFLSMLGPSAIWVSLIPIVICAFAWSSGPRETPQATWFVFAAMLYATALFVIRVDVAMRAFAQPPEPATYAPMVALLASCALWLRPRPTSAADAWAIVAVAAQSVLLVPAFFGRAPAFVFAALIASWSTARLATERISKASARWVVPAYVFAYAAFQRIDQLVPSFVLELMTTVKKQLGYESAPMPPSYVSIYGALFVAVIGVLAALNFTRSRDQRRAEADMLLWCTAVASVIFGGTAMLSLLDDVRPAIVATPLLAVLGLALGLGLNRRELTVSGALLSIASAAAYMVWLKSGVPVALVALVLAALSILATQKHREVLSVTAFFLAMASLGPALSMAPSVPQSLSLAVASLAALSVARNLNHTSLMSIAWLLPFVFVVRTVALVDPFLAPLGLAVAALVGAFVSRAQSRLESLWLPASFAALLAAAWGLLSHEAESGLGTVFGGLELPVSAAALLVGAHVQRRRSQAVPFEAAGLIIATLTLLPPLGESLVVFGWLTPLLSVCLAIGVAVASSVRAIRVGREWQSVLVAAMVCLISLLDVAHASTERMAVLAGLVFFLSTPALIASVTMPMALALWAGAANHSGSLVFLALAIAATLLSLFEEFELTWRYVLNRSRVSWAASLSSAVLLGISALADGPPSAWVLGATIVLPMVWVRATRSTVLASASLLLTFALATQLDSVFLYLPPLVAVVLSRLTELEGVRRALKLERPTFGVRFLIGAVFTSLATAGLAHVESLGVGLPLAWAVCLLLMRDNTLAARVIAAATVLLAVPATWPAAALVLAALAFALHHGGSRASRIFGADAAAFAASSAILSGVSLAALHVGLHGGSVSVAVLATTLVCAGLLFDWAPAVTLALVSLGFDIFGLAHGTGPILRPHALEVSLVGAALAALLRVPLLSAPLEHAWARLGRQVGRPLASPLWVGAFLLGLASLTVPSPVWLLLVPLLLLTPNRLEAALALPLGALMVLATVPHEIAGLTFALAGAALSWAAVFFEKRFEVLRMWHHAGWVLSLLALGLCTDLRSPHFAEVWALMALSMWAVAKRNRSLDIVGFIATLAAAHAVLAHVGIVLSTGAPHALILPWFSLVSILVAAWPLVRTSSTQRKVFGWLAASLAVLELLAGIGLLTQVYPREAMVGVVAMVLVVALAVVRALKDDDAVATLIGQVAVMAGVLCVDHLGLGNPLRTTETWACIVFGFVLSELGKRATSEVSAALRFGAYAWPTLGLVALVGQEPAVISWVLMAVAAHFTVMARSSAARGKAAIAAVIAFNAAMVFGYQATGWSEPQYLAIPFGVSMLTLVWVFKRSLEGATVARLRAVAIAIIYGAASWSPLMFEQTWALWLCVLICVIGVAVGIVLRIRSFVFLGTAFMVTSIVANLVRYGIRDPRAGAIFLSGLGLLVVGFMVLVTTKRAELLARYRSVQQLLSRWER